MQKIVHNILARVSPSSTARIVGLTWRLDYAVQSNTVGKMSSSRFIVSIKIQGGNDNVSLSIRLSLFHYNLFFRNQIL